MRIKKIAPVTPPNGLLENTYGTSQTNGYTQEYINNYIKSQEYNVNPLYGQLITLGKMKIFSGSIVLRFEDGVQDLDISSLGLKSVPYGVQLTMSTGYYCIKYDYDNSTKDTLKLKLYNMSGLISGSQLQRIAITIYGFTD